MKMPLPAAVLAVVVATTACSAPSYFSPSGSGHPVGPQDVFLGRVRALCGQSFEGRVTTTDPADAAFAGQRLVMQVQCVDGTVRIPFAVGEDRSRTWVISQTASGLRLKHDHRHADGTEDILSQYGGDTANEGTVRRQEFPVDQFSKDLFTREGRTVSNTNVWALEMHPEERFAYELRRPGRHFRVEFDLTRPVTP